MRKIILAAVAAVTTMGFGIASAQVEEVVVTGSRVPEYEGAPHIVLIKRADHLIAEVHVLCDTRDDKQRREEMMTTLRGMLRAAAASKTISFGHGDAIVGDVTEAGLDDMIVPDTRPDSSRIDLIVKTTVTKDDTFETATGRIKDFLAAVTKVGRTEVRRGDRWDLTIIGPEQYRDALIAKIVADAHHSAGLFGPNDDVSIDGLEQPVAWYQKGPLDLALYVPYKLHIAPR
jgi:hypothetical protein